MRTFRIGMAALILLAAATAAWATAQLERLRGTGIAGAQVLYLPSGKYLRAVSMGFPELLADAVYIWSIQYYSNYENENRFEFLEHIYGNVISELDPRYIDPYLIGSLIMSVEAGDHAMALRLLDKGMQANPGEWILPFEAGFTCYNLLGDYERAARYFERAMAVPGAPGVIRRFRAEMFNKMGDKRSSLVYWREVLEQAENDYVRNVSFSHVHDLTIEVDIQDLETAVSAYRERAGHLPGRLEDLVRAGLVDRLPADPDGNPYAYDPVTGSVTCRSRFMLHRRAGS